MAKKKVEAPVVVEIPEGGNVGIVVVKPFRDKYDRKTMYGIGEELFFDEERANDLVSRGLAEPKPAGDTDNESETNIQNDGNSQ